MTPFLKPKRAATAVVFVTAAAALFASAPLVGGAAPAGGTGGYFIDTCIKQEPCLKWVVTKVPGTRCSIAADKCPVQVCMKFDLNAPGCSKQSGTVSHACDNADSSGCVRAEPWTLGSGKGTSVDFDASGTCTSPGSNTRCPNIPDEYSMCQTGKPGDTLYFTVYV